MQNPFLFEAESLGYQGEYEGEVQRGRRSPGGYRPSSGRSHGGSSRYPPSYSGRKRPYRRYPGGSSYPIYPSYTYGGAAPAQESRWLIRVVQKLLNRALGLDLPVDGVMSVETLSAIRSFQSQNGSPLYGGAAAGSAPVEGPAPPDQMPGDEQGEYYFESNFEWEGEVSRSSPEYIRWVQQSLNRILGLRLAVDGVSGTQTRSAIRSFQQQQSLTADGIVGPATEAALIRAGAGQPPQSSGTPSGGTPTTGTPDIVSVRGIRVARQIASRVEALLAAAAANGVRLSGWGYRSTAQQIQLRIAHCGGNTHYNIYEKPSSQCNPPTAPPGRSMHEKGLAIDFTYNGGSIGTHSNPGYIWLANNAARFGLYNLPSEPWHWSVNGN